jgi:putative DNA primase/helicase
LSKHTSTGEPDGTPYLRVQRTEDKQFPQSHWDGKKYVKGRLKGAKIPYRLDELSAASKDIPVFIVEGEKDADRLASLDLIATTVSEGAGKWTPELNQWFAGRTVYILADNDGPGRKHAHTVARNLHPIAASVRVVQPEGLPAKGDVSDWLDADTEHTKEALLELCIAAPIWTEEQAKAAAVENNDSDDDVITEDSVALSFPQKHGGTLLYDHDAGMWYHYERNCWRPDRTGLAFEWSRRLAREATRSEPARVRNITSRTNFAAGVERYARSDRIFAVTSEDWDADAFSLGTPDGTVDLRSGTMRSANSRDRITKTTSVAPAETADCPGWIKFLQDTT